MSSDFPDLKGYQQIQDSIDQQDDTSLSSTLTSIHDLCDFLPEPTFFNATTPPASEFQFQFQQDSPIQISETTNLLKRQIEKSLQEPPDAKKRKGLQLDKARPIDTHSIDYYQLDFQDGYKLDEDISYEPSQLLENDDCGDLASMPDETNQPVDPRRDEERRRLVQFLQDIGLPQLEQVLIEEEVLDLDTLLPLSDEELKEVGIQKLIHRKKIRAAAERLRMLSGDKKVLRQQNSLHEDLSANNSSSEARRKKTDGVPDQNKENRKPATGGKKDSNEPICFKVGDKGLQIAKGTPPWPVRIVGVVDSKFKLVYFGTNQTGLSKKNGTDLLPFNEEMLLTFKSRDTKRKDLKKAIVEALED